MGIISYLRQQYRLGIILYAACLFFRIGSVSEATIAPKLRRLGHRNYNNVEVIQLPESNTTNIYIWKHKKKQKKMTTTTTTTASAPFNILYNISLDLGVSSNSDVRRSDALPDDTSNVNDIAKDLVALLEKVTNMAKVNGLPNSNTQPTSISQLPLNKITAIPVTTAAVNKIITNVPRNNGVIDQSVLDQLSSLSTKNVQQFTLAGALAQLAQLTSSVNSPVTAVWPSTNSQSIAVITVPGSAMQNTSTTAGFNISGD